MEQLDIKSLYEDELKRKDGFTWRKTVQGKTAVSVAHQKAVGVMRR